MIDFEIIEKFQDDLDSCPCCGKEAYLSVVELASGRYEGTVSCTCCGLQISEIRYTPELAAEETVAGWNRRVYK